MQSVLKQTYKNFEAIFISDGSTDDTLGLKSCEGINDARFFAEVHNKNMGAAYRRLMAVKKYSTSQEDVILLLGLDDELLPNALERIAKEYEAGKWMTYGNWKNQYGKVPMTKALLSFDPETHATRDYRKVKYRSTAPNTFKRFLFDRIPEEDFKLDGKWIDSTTESEVMFSCLEMCGINRIGLIEEPIYLYNEGLPGGTLKRLGVGYKYNIYNRIINRPKRDLLTHIEPMTKVSKQIWAERMSNLIQRRAFTKPSSGPPSKIGDYKTHLSKIELGKTLLDVGCGSCALKEFVPAGTEYIGLDPYPQKAESYIHKGTIEEMEIEGVSYDTVCMFAALDNVFDFKKAIENIKQIAAKNVLFLTGVNIEPDKYHTIKITEDLLINEMKPFKVGHMEYLADKVLLIEFKL